MSDLFMVRPFCRRTANCITNQIFTATMLLLTFSLLANVSSTAQTITGTVSGTVIDSSGAVLPGAAITLIDQRTGTMRRATTGTDGRFTFAALQPETYTVKIEKQGFQSREQKSIVLSANENLALGQLELKTGGVNETVLVTDGGSRVDTESSDLTTRLTADQISLIPVKGRDITSLLRVLPGTSFDDDIEAVGEGFGTNLPNFSGQRGRSAVATVDGLNGAEPSGNNKLSMTINQDAIAEVKVLRNNYAAEYGNNGGAMVNLVTKSGSQSYHGTGYYFLRNEAFNANNYLSNNAGVNRAMYRHNIWGVTLGGPVQIPKIFPNREKNKLFFFYAYEKPHTITPQDPRLVTVPTALERQGDFSQSIDSSGKPVVVLDPLTGKQFPGNKIPKDRWNSSGVAILNFFPLPNNPGSFNYLTQKSVDVPKRSQVARFDIKPNDSDTISVHTQQWTSDNEGFQTSGWPGGTPPDSNVWGISSHYLYKDDGATLGWVHVLNPLMVNEMTLGIRHDTEGFIPSTGVIDRLSRTTLNYTAPQIFPENNLLGTIPRVTNWTSVAGRPANINWLDRWGEVGSDHIYPSVSENFTWNRGIHTFKFGSYFENLINTEAPGGNWSGTFNFAATGSGASNFTTGLGNTGYAYANALLGNFNSYTEDSKRPFTNLQLMLLQWYAQDEWKVSPRLTLNYGLRVGY
ncbi:MAG TPA: carboxypeptidase regulatory-like domain-containing protein, partial [Terriglobales bacterium]